MHSQKGFSSSQRWEDRTQMTRDKAYKKLPGEVNASVLITICRAKRPRTLVRESDASTTCTDEEDVNGTLEIKMGNAEKIKSKKQELKKSVAEIRRRIIEDAKNEEPEWRLPPVVSHG